MRPMPRMGLLLANQTWSVVPAPGWEVLTRSLRCRYRDDFRVGSCARPAVVTGPPDQHSGRTVTPIAYCEDHMGSIRWVDGDRVMQWRASPPWTQYMTRRFEREARQPQRRAAAVSDIDPQTILDTPMQDNDANAATVGAYLVALAREVWRENEGFSGKRPFGNSGWEHEVYTALAIAGHIESADDGYGGHEISGDQERFADSLIEAALDELALPVGDVPTGEESGDLPPTSLSVGQQIRLEVARMLLVEWEVVASDPDGHMDEFVQDVLRLSAAIETGEAPAAETPEQSAAIVDANLVRMGSAGLDGQL